MSLRLAIVLAAIIFCITLLARLPARLGVSFLPSDVICEDPSGTLWQGSCGQLRNNGLSIAGVSWKLHPLALLGLKVNADVISSDPNVPASASIEAARNGDVAIRDLDATLPLAAASHLLPNGDSATLVLALPAAKIRSGHLVAIEGTIQLQQLHIANPSADLGSYELQFPSGSSQSSDTVSTMVGQLRDLEGPLAVSGQVHLQPNGTYEADGTVVARDTASDDLNKVLQLFLGPADSRGQRTFSLAGSL
jgi:hypothetical protein